MKKKTVLLLAMMVLPWIASVFLSCGGEMDSESVIESRRFLSVVADPIEAAPGETVTLTAVITESNGSLYDGALDWKINTENSPSDSEAPFAFSTDSGSVLEWNVPDESDLVSAFGPMEEHGWLLKLKVSTEGGGSKTAYKRFVVSNRTAETRAANPRIDSMNLSAAGERLTADDEGLFTTDRAKVTFSAETNENEDNLFFDWYSTSSDFEPDRDSVQTFEPDGDGMWTFFCVVRKNYDFRHDNSSITSYSGTTWWRGSVRFR